MAWYREIDRMQWRILAAAQLGWILDAMCMMMYSFALAPVRAEFGLSSAVAGALAAAPLATSAAGGALFGYLSDRYGRARAMSWSILTFSVLTGLTATARSPLQLVLWRAAAGIPLGGEWAAGSVLVAETWPPQHRAKGIGLMQSGWAIGYMTAALLSALALPTFGWRAMFWFGLAPAAVTWWIRRTVPESAEWRKRGGRGRGMEDGERKARFARGLFSRNLFVLTAMCCCLLFGYWGLFTWIPTYLATPVAQGGAGLSVVKSAAWIMPMQMGAFCGYVLFGFLADRFGRKPAFLCFVLSTAALVPVYGLLGRNSAVLLAISPLLGFFGHGYYSALGVIMAEIFPVDIRATALGICYNTGRAVSALAPVSVGAIADRFGIGAGLGFTSVFFLAGAALMLLVPETKR
ncbi:MAG TPA: MFS transporter [Bryobacteraceae bacterium]|nr:MFS transporter [Bryobacteraceae bacterium]